MMGKGSHGRSAVLRRLSALRAAMNRAARFANIMRPAAMHTTGLRDDQKKSCSQVLTRCVSRSTPGDDMRLRPPAEAAAPCAIWVAP